MDADLDTLATARYVRTDDLLKASPGRVPWRPKVGIAPKITDAELIDPGGDAGPARAHQRGPLVAPCPLPPARTVPVSARAARLTTSGCVGWARRSAGWSGSGPRHHPVDRRRVGGRLDPVECARSRETVKRKDLAGVGRDGTAPCHSSVPLGAAAVDRAVAPARSPAAFAAARGATAGRAPHRQGDRRSRPGAASRADRAGRITTRTTTDASSTRDSPPRRRGARVPPEGREKPGIGLIVEARTAPRRRRYARMISPRTARVIVARQEADVSRSRRRMSDVRDRDRGRGLRARQARAGSPERTSRAVGDGSLPGDGAGGQPVRSGTRGPGPRGSRRRAAGPGAAAAGRCRPGPGVRRRLVERAVPSPSAGPGGAGACRSAAGSPGFAVTTMSGRTERMFAALRAPSSAAGSGATML